MKINNFIFSVLLLLFQASLVLGQNPIIKKIKLPNPRNIRINQLSNLFDQHVGILHQEGLWEFNGKVFNEFSEILNGKNITSYSNSNDTSLIGTAAGELFYFKEKQPLELIPKWKKTKSSISSIVFKDHRIWVATAGGGLFVNDRDKWININSTQHLKDDYLHKVIPFLKGVLVASDAGISYCFIEKNKIVVKNITTKEGLKDNLVIDLVPKNKNEIWIMYYEKGISLINNNLILSEPTNIENYPVRSLISNENILWLNIQKKGVFYYNKNDSTYNRLNFPNEISLNEKMKLHQDIQQNAWIYDANNLYFTLGEKIVKQSAGNLNSKSIQSVLTTSINQLWVSTKDHLTITKINTGEKDHQTEILLQSIANHSILNMQENNGFVWMGTFGEGIYIYNLKSKKIFHLNEKNGLNNNNTFSIKFYDNSVFCSTLGGVSRIINSNGQFIVDKKFNKNRKIPNTYFYDLLRTKENKLWCLSDGNGIYIYDNENQEVNHLSKKELPFTNAYQIKEDKNGKIWIAAGDDGLISFQNEVFTKYNTKNGLGGDEIFQIELLNDENILVTHENGLDIFNIKTFESKTYSDELSENFTNEGLHTTSIYKNNCFVGIDTTVFKLNIDDVTEKDITSFHIESISVNNKIRLDKAHTFQSNENNIDFVLDGSWFANPELVNFQYRLLGYNNKWFQTKDQSVSYSQLPSGEYSFQMAGKTNNTIVSDLKHDEISFTILKPFYQTWWFKTSCLLLAVTILGFLIHLREKKLERNAAAAYEKSNYEYNLLKSQINPHFLFNSFNTLVNLVDVDSKKAIQYIEKLTDLFRQILKHNNTSLISLQDELSVLENYIYLQKERMGNKFKINFYNINHTQDYYLPPMCLQLLIENAFKHNVISLNLPLEISITQTEGAISIKNNKMPKLADTESFSIGLENVQRRLNILNLPEMKINDSKTSFEVIVPLSRLKNVI